MDNRINIMNCRFNRITMGETLNQVKESILRDEQNFLCTVNVSILMMMRSNKLLSEIVRKAKWVVADGMPIIWVSRTQKNPLPERVTGVELVSEIAEVAANNGWGVYLLGGEFSVVEKVAAKLKSDKPGLIISGFADGYFDDKEAIDRAAAVKKSGARILIVAMGVPKQEYFIDKHFKDTGVNFVIGVGGSFDVVSGKVKRAPKWIQKMGLEWAYRIKQEPKRLLPRYLKTNSLFIFLLLKDFISSALRKNSTQR